MQDTPQEAMIGDKAARELLASEKALQVKHAPAPWHVGEKYPTDIYANRAGHAIARTCNPQIDGECEANARLIAAAPELLEALQGLMTGFNGQMQDENAYKKANAAIAKALGETK